MARDGDEVVRDASSERCARDTAATFVTRTVHDPIYRGALNGPVEGIVAHALFDAGLWAIVSYIGRGPVTLRDRVGTGAGAALQEEP